MPNKALFPVPGSGAEYQWRMNCYEGMMVKAPTSASTQATGASGASVYRVNIDTGVIILDGQKLNVAAQADLTLGGDSAECTSGQSKVIAVIYYKSLGNGSILQKIVKGAAATTGAQVTPTDATIDALFPAGTPWIRLANVTFNRTGDTSVTQSQDNSVRPLGVPPANLK